MEMPKLENQGTVNKNSVTIGGLTIAFSYETPICFEYKSKDGGYETMTRVNDWSTTTGKYLNELEPDKSKRVSGEVFEKRLSEIVASL